jgi:hypothetical protein
MKIMDGDDAVGCLSAAPFHLSTLTQNCDTDLYILGVVLT